LNNGHIYKYNKTLVSVQKRKKNKILVKKNSLKKKIILKITNFEHSKRWLKLKTSLFGNKFLNLFPTLANVLSNFLFLNLLAWPKKKDIYVRFWLFKKINEFFGFCLQLPDCNNLFISFTNELIIPFFFHFRFC